MAEKFPVVLQKDGKRRTAHSLIAYNQLVTQGFAEESQKKAAPKKTAAKAEPKKADEKPAEKADNKSEDK